jgi:uncharacterized membrane protein YqjE
MNPASASLGRFSDSSKRVGERLLTIAENRLELLAVEVQEERDRLIHALLLALALATLGLLAGMALSAAIVVMFWAYSPVMALLILVALYAAGTICLYARLHRLRQEWETLPATREQLRKDRECVEQLLN